MDMLHGRPFYLNHALCHGTQAMAYTGTRLPPGKTGIENRHLKPAPKTGPEQEHLPLSGISALPAARPAPSPARASMPVRSAPECCIAKNPNKTSLFPNHSATNRTFWFFLHLAKKFTGWTKLIGRQTIVKRPSQKRILPFFAQVCSDKPFAPFWFSCVFPLTALKRPERQNPPSFPSHEASHPAASTQYMALTSGSFLHRRQLPHCRHQAFSRVH